MEYLKKITENGISLRVVYKVLLIVAIVVSVLLLYTTYHSSSTFYKLSDATDEYIELQKAAYELMNASDYLTESVQRFTIGGNMKFLNDYFREAFESKHREDAIAKMSQNSNSEAALKELQHALNESINLMNREYYAMKLVIEAKGYQNYPEVLQNVSLTEEDAALSARDKMDLAQTMVLDDEYYSQKEQIRGNMQNSLAQLEELTHGTQKNATKELQSHLKVVRILIIFQTIGIMVMIWLTANLGINPVLKAVDNIREDNPIPVVGANEFRYLAKTYNKMYTVYKSSIAHLNFKASHDELTKVYNRAGYELILSSLDLNSTYMLLADADNFKEINDTFGHEIGDRVLQKIAETLRRNFRSDDYICRIGGDEFVIFMVHSDESQKNLIDNKIRQINKELQNTEDGLPAITVSVGIVHGKDLNSPEEFMHYADQMLYKSKQAGRNGFHFYEG